MHAPPPRSIATRKIYRARTESEVMMVVLQRVLLLIVNVIGRAGQMPNHEMVCLWLRDAVLLRVC